MRKADNTYGWMILAIGGMMTLASLARLAGLW
jgi:hypothetical protein